MATIVLNPGETITIQFAGNDGEFKVHNSTDEYPNSIVVEETNGLAGNICGAANSILYHEKGEHPKIEDEEADEGALAEFIPEDTYDPHQDLGETSPEVDNRDPRDTRSIRKAIVAFHDANKK